MKCRSLRELLAVAAAATLCACASAPAPTARPPADLFQVGDKALGNARIAWSECVHAAIPRLNTPQSSSEVVGRDAMKGCSDEYAAMIQALAQALPPSCSQDPHCKRHALETAQRDATKNATHEVVTARVRAAGAASLKCQ